MRRWICLVLGALCVLGLWYCNELWGSLSGQVLYRLTANVNKDLQHSLTQIASDHNTDLAAFAMGKVKLDGITSTEEIQLYECLSYHPEALGVLIVKGSPITQEQIDRSDPVIMLSEGAAMRLSPAFDCIGSIVSLDDTPYRVVGTYKHYEPVGFLTRTAEASAIIPLHGWNKVRRLYIWLRPQKASPFIFQQAIGALQQMETSKDADTFQAIDLDKSEQMSQQGVRFWLLLMLSLICWRAFKAMSGMRRSLLDRAKQTFTRYYSVRASARLIWPFAKYIAPSLVVPVGWSAYLVYCANRLLISADRVPKQLLDPEAWLAKQTTHTISSNLAESMPVYAYLLNEHLHWICLALGLLGTCLLWIGLKPHEKRMGD